MRVIKIIVIISCHILRVINLVTIIKIKIKRKITYWMKINRKKYVNIKAIRTKK
jgi:hypothetical protein